MKRQSAHLSHRTIIASVIAGILTVAVGVSLVIAPDKTSAQLAIESGGAGVSASEVGAQSGAGGQSGAQAHSGGGATPTPFDASQPVSEAVQPVTGENVSVIGDSVTLASAASLQESLPGIDISAEVSRSYYAGMSITGEWAQSGRLRPYVVIALATNGPLPMDAAEQMVQNCGPDRRIVFVTGFGPASVTWIEQSNQTIRDIAAKYPGRVAVADWASTIQPHQDLLAGDSIHPSGEGGALFAQAVESALASFGGEIPAQASSKESPDSSPESGQ